MEKSFEEPVLQSPYNEGNGGGGGRAETQADRMIDIQNGVQKSVQIMKRAEINPQAFVENYTYDAVKADMDRARELEGIFQADRLKMSSGEREAKDLATILEAVVLEKTAQYRWFGPHADMVKTSPFDDYVNGVDGVLKIEDPHAVATGFLPLTYDVTYAANIDKKLGRVKSEIMAGKQAKVKYFQTKGFKGEVSGPRFVLCADGRTVNDMVKLWKREGLRTDMSNLEQRKANTDKVNESRRAFRDHFIQHQFAEEILLQCREYAAFVESQERRATTEEQHIYHANYAESLRKIEAYFEKLNSARIIKDKGDRDAGFAALVDRIPAFFR